MERPDLTTTPAISVVLPFRDAAATLSDCLDSIARQTSTDHEVVAIDDGSSDDSAAIVRHRAAGDRRLRLSTPGRIGLVAALNLGLGQSRASLIARMDADDLMKPRRLEVQAARLGEQPELALVGCRVELFPESGIRAGYRRYVEWQNGCLGPQATLDNLYVESPFAHPSVTFRRAVVAGLGGYSAGDFPEDYHLWLRMAQSGHAMAKVPEVLLAWRDGPRRLSRTDPRYSREAFDRLRADFLSQDRRLLGDRPVAIWGAGRRTRARARHLLRRGIRPVAWIDIDPKKIGRRFDGLPVFEPDRLDASPRPFVLGYVTSHGAREQISARLDALGYRVGRDYLHVG
ncbi:MAG TPA: glycosyltransferase [Thermoanaerobaculia bacterium]|nr:glycosyltransferase [Thermoanaerobaculia bacterium]